MSNQHTENIADPVQPDSNAQKRAIAKAENANAWLLLTAAQANRDTQQFGEWRMDYVACAGGHQAEFDAAMAELDPK